MRGGESLRRQRWQQKTPQINDMIGWMRANNLAARATRILVHQLYFFDVFYQPRREIFKFVVRTADAKKGNLSFRCSYVKTIRAN